MNYSDGDFGADIIRVLEIEINPERNLRDAAEICVQEIERLKRFERRIRYVTEGGLL
jgi:hypothetical protein